MPLWSFETLTADALRPAFAAGELFVARRQDNGEAVGAMSLQEEDRIFWPEVPPGEALFLHKLAVRRAAAGCGVSRCMIRWAADEARRRGLRSLRLDCDGTRPALRTFYESAGCTFVDERLMRSWVAARFVLTIPQETPTTP
jgi:GNAT superfamily N-acetyltransferase